MSNDTIYALATGRVRSAIAVLRVSGPASGDVVARLTGGRLPEPRCLVRRDIFSAEGDLIDDAMVVMFAEGASYTGEAAAELHCHGGPAVIAAVLNALSACDGTRVAEPGEFTRRAVMNGRVDLTEAEGIGDLIAAETELQRRQALRVMSGAVADQAEHWRAILLEARALVELTIDWADEEVPEDVSDDVRLLLSGLAAELRVELDRSAKAERLRTGFEVALVGAPNVGKSSLLNAIVGREAAITSDVPGTTRDVIEVRYDLSGVPVMFLDLAGLREASDRVEQIGVARARARAEAADLRLFLEAPDVPRADLGVERAGLDLTVSTKADVGGARGELAVSAVDGSGVDDLLMKIADRLPSSLADVGLLSHHRHCIAVEECYALVRKCVESVGGADLEVIAEDLRAATAHLERVIGRVGVEDVLGAVFSTFCLGK